MVKYHLYIYIYILLLLLLFLLLHIITYYYHDVRFLIIGSLFLSKQNIQAFQEKIVLFG